MCKLCTWCTKLFGCKCKCKCHKKDEVTSSANQAPTNNEVKPSTTQPENVEKNQ